jgi:hypothetical protein
MDRHCQHCFCIENLQDLTFLIDEEVQEIDALLSVLTQSKTLLEGQKHNNEISDHLLILDGKIQVLQVKQQDLKAQVDLFAHTENLLSHQCLPEDMDHPSILSALHQIKHNFVNKVGKFKGTVNSIQLIISHLEDSS